MIKSFNRRKNISKRINAASIRTDARIEGLVPFDIRKSLKAVGIKPNSKRKCYQWERTFHDQDAAGVRTQGGHPEDWEFLDGACHFVDGSKPCKQLRKPITAGV
jgi:hypothetical protein